jgi:hypothetical protein
VVYPSYTKGQVFIANEGVLIAIFGQAISMLKNHGLLPGEKENWE